MEAYKARLRAGIERTRRRLAEFEARYGVSTAYFQRMTAEDLEGGDKVRLSLLAVPVRLGLPLTYLRDTKKWLQ